MTISLIDQDEDRKRGGEREREGENLGIPGGLRRATAIIARETYLDLNSNCKKISSSTFTGQWKVKLGLCHAIKEFLLMFF